MQQNNEEQKQQQSQAARQNIKRVVVLGGMGFIGSQFIQHIIFSKLNWQILSIDKTLPQLVKIPQIIKDQIANKVIKHIQTDLSIEENVIKIWEEEQVSNSDVVVNCAGETRWGMNPLEYQHRISNLSTYCAKHSDIRNVAKFIEISHSYVYKATQRPQKENSKEILPQNVIGEFKLAAEQAIEKMKSLNYTILRPSLVYGPGDTGQIIKRTIISLTYNYTKEEQRLLYTGQLPLNTVHVDDLCSIILECILQSSSHQKVYNVSSPQNTSYEDIYQVISKVTASKYSFAGNFLTFFAKQMGLSQALDEINNKHLITWSRIENQLEIKEEIGIQLYLYQEEVERQQISVDGSYITQDLNIQYKHKVLTTSLLTESIIKSIEYGLLPEQILQFIKL